MRSGHRSWDRCWTASRSARIMLGCALLMGASLVALGRSHSAWLSAIVIAGPLAFATQGAGILTANALVVRWFSVHRGRAMAIALTGMSLGGILLPPLIAALIEHARLASDARECRLRGGAHAGGAGSDRARTSPGPTMWRAGRLEPTTRNRPPAKRGLERTAAESDVAAAHVAILDDRGELGADARRRSGSDDHARSPGAGRRDRLRRRRRA